MNYLAQLLKPFNTSLRLKRCGESEPTAWDWPLFTPVPGVLETGSAGPFSVEEVEWIEIQPVEYRHIGNLVPEQEFDHTEKLNQALAEAGFNYAFQDGVFRVYAG